VLAAPAAANQTQESIFQDDGVLQQSGTDAQTSALKQIKDLGADTVHVLVGWRRIAPSPDSRTKPAGFDASDPASYPAGAFDSLDSLVRQARADGLDVIFTPTSSIPDWASQCSTAQARKGKVYTCDPDPAEFQQFVTALGRHFSGDLAVKRWSIWNEPNFKGWLRPQFTKVHGQVVANAAIMYRNLLRAGIAGLQASGHGGDAIYAGETAPIGQSRGRPGYSSVECSASTTTSSRCAAPTPAPTSARSSRSCPSAASRTTPTPRAAAWPRPPACATATRSR
jgi:hypothetical protein